MHSASGTLVKSMDVCLDEIISFGSRKRVTSKKRQTVLRVALLDEMDLDDEVIIDAMQQVDVPLVMTEAVNPPTSITERAVFVSGQISQEASCVPSTTEPSVDMDIDDWSLSNELRNECIQRDVGASLLGGPLRSNIKQPP